ncbi:MAG: hypothetical protein ABFE07_25845 [Armatimonadia bacterium]
MMFSGCGPSPHRGTIIAKRHEPAHTQSVVIPVIDGLVPSSIPLTYAIPDMYLLTVKLRRTGEEQTVTVPADEFVRLKVGDSYRVP